MELAEARLPESSGAIRDGILESMGLYQNDIDDLSQKVIVATIGCSDLYAEKIKDSGKSLRCIVCGEMVYGSFAEPETCVHLECMYALT